MNVKIPEAPKHFSKAAVSTRQEVGIRPTTAGSAIAQRDTPWRSGSDINTKELLTTADLALDVDHGGAESTSSVNRDLGRDREMCSSPRLHESVQGRMRELQSAEKRTVFVRRIVQQGSLQPQKLVTPTASLAPTPVPVLTNTESMQLQPSMQVPHPPPGGENHQCDGATGQYNPSAASKRYNTKTRPSSCFASTAKRFVSVPSAVPPVGHYNVRFTVVDKEERKLHLGQHPQRGQSPVLDGTMGGTGGAVAKSALELPNKGCDSNNENNSQVAGSDADGADAVEKQEQLSREGNTPMKSKRQIHSAPAQKPTSAFASRIPQLVSLTPRRAPYRDDATSGQYNDNILSTSKSPRTTVCMSRSSKKPRTVATNPTCGAHAVYEVERGMKAAARPTAGGAVKGDATYRNVDFGRQVGRDIHVVDGMKYAAFSNPNDELDADAKESHNQVGADVKQSQKRRSVRQNDPARDGCSTDYVNWSEVNKPTVKGVVKFDQQTSRKALRPRPPKAGDQLEEDDAKEVTLHKGVVNFEKMHKPSSHSSRKYCRVDTYDIPNNDRLQVVNLGQGGSHVDHHSTFAKVKQAAGSASGDQADSKLVHRKIVRNIDMAKLSPRRGVGTRDAKRASTARVGGQKEQLYKKTVGGPVGDKVWMDYRKAANTASRTRVMQQLTTAQRLLQLEADTPAQYSSADAPIVNPRVTGNPHIGQHISRQERAHAKEYRSVATSARDYTVDTNTMSRQAREVMGRASSLEFQKMLSRENKVGGRLGAEYALHDGPGPGSYEPFRDTFSPPKSAAPKSSK